MSIGIVTMASEVVRRLIHHQWTQTAARLVYHMLEEEGKGREGLGNT